MPLPTFRCPVCRNALTLDVVFAHDGVRDAILHLLNAHPAAGKLLRPLLGYIGLFAPVKTEMRYERVAALLAELVPLIHAGTVEDGHGRTWPAPLEYWGQAFEQMLANRDTGSLRLPLKSHGYLCAIVAGFSNKSDAASERHTEAQRAGHAGFGTAPARHQPVTVSEPAPRTPMSGQARQELLRAAGSRRADIVGENQ